MHVSAAASVGDAELQGRDPPLRPKVKLGSDGVPKEIVETRNGAVPLFLIVTSKGAGVLPPVTLPKSYVAGKTAMTGLPAGGAGVAPLEPPPPPPHAVTAIVMKSIATAIKCFFINLPCGEAANCCGCEAVHVSVRTFAVRTEQLAGAGRKQGMFLSCRPIQRLTSYVVITQ